MTKDQPETLQGEIPKLMLGVRSYLEELLIQRAEDTLNWWEAKASVYPHLVEYLKERAKHQSTCSNIIYKKECKMLPVVNMQFNLNLG